MLAYHNVRWLSLNGCVQRFTDLLPEIVQYFDQESHSNSNRPSERSQMQEFYDELVQPEFQLYLFSQWQSSYPSQHKQATSEI